MKDLNDANEYLKSKKKGKEEFRPSYHLSPDYGWCNDPHGIVFFHGLYHFFFQYNPYETKAENIFWGHVTSKDLVSFSKTTCAIAPDMPYDNSGCWSGSSIVIDDTLYLIYTGFSLHKDGKYYQTICLAESKDGIHFTKYPKNPIIDTCDIPSFASIYDFRDPCILKREGKYYLIIGSKTKDEKEAELLLYEGEDIHNFHFKKVLVHSGEYGTMFECPNLFTGKEKDYLILSPQNLKETNGNFANISSCIYFPIDKDFLHKEIEMENVKEIDHGTEFYAPTVYDDKQLTVSWMQMWGRRYYLDEINNDFINSFSLFKTIQEENDGLSFRPILPESVFSKTTEESILLNSKKELSDSDTLALHLECDMDETQILTFCFHHNIFFTIDREKNQYTLDKSKAEIPLYGVEQTGSEKGIRYLNKKIPDRLSLDIYIDKASHEIFFDDFKESFSFLCFDKEQGISIKAKNPVNIFLKTQTREEEK